MVPNTNHNYIISGGKPGADRLTILANATWPTSKSFLLRAGLTSGMRCLDVGCGNGEISLRLAALLTEAVDNPVPEIMVKFIGE